MKSLLLMMVGVLAIASLITACTEKDYILYRPVEKKNEMGRIFFQRNDTINTLEHQKAMVEILSSYNEIYKFDESGMLLITKSLSADLDLLCNYTSKAEILRESR